MFFGAQRRGRKGKGETRAHPVASRHHAYRISAYRRGKKKERKKAMLLWTFDASKVQEMDQEFRSEGAHRCSEISLDAAETLSTRRELSSAIFPSFNCGFRRLISNSFFVVVVDGG